MKSIIIAFGVLTLIATMAQADEQQLQALQQSINTYKTHLKAIKDALPDDQHLCIWHAPVPPPPDFCHPEIDDRQGGEGIADDDHAAERDLENLVYVTDISPQEINAALKEKQDEDRKERNAALVDGAKVDYSNPYDLKSIQAEIEKQEHNAPAMYLEPDPVTNFIVRPHNLTAPTVIACLKFGQQHAATWHEPLKVVCEFDGMVRAVFYCEKTDCTRQRITAEQGGDFSQIHDDGPTTHIRNYSTQKREEMFDRIAENLAEAARLLGDYGTPLPDYWPSMDDEKRMAEETTYVKQRRQSIIDAAQRRQEQGLYQ